MAIEEQVERVSMEPKAHNDIQLLATEQTLYIIAQYCTQLHSTAKHCTQQLKSATNCTLMQTPAQRCIALQVLAGWKIPFLSLTKSGDTAEKISAALIQMEKSPKVLIASISTVAKEETKKFLRRQNIHIISVDEAQVHNIIF